MRTSHRSTFRAALMIALLSIITIASIRLRADTGTCSGASITLPFVDVPAGNVFFCSIAEAFLSGLSNGTDATHYSPSANVAREQMAAFVTRTMDQSLKRGSMRAALGQFWTTQSANNIPLTTVGTFPSLIKSDGADLWVANESGNSVSRVRAGDGKLIGTWTGATEALGVLCATGKVFVTGGLSPGKLYQIDPTQAPGAVTTLSSALGSLPTGISYDGQKIWTANNGSVSIITLNPVTVTNVTLGFSQLNGAIYDGNNIWVTDNIPGPIDQLHKLDSAGAILQSVDVGGFPGFPAFDGINIWVPNQDSNSVSVVRASGSLAGTVLATLTGNGLNSPMAAAFDGERILVTSPNVNVVSLWKASDLTPIGTFSTPPGTGPYGACSDKRNFWITMHGTNKIGRF